MNYIGKTGRYIGERPRYYLREFIVRKEIKNPLSGEVEKLEIEKWWVRTPDQKETVIKDLKSLKFN